MDHRLLQELRLRNFRCFREQQAARLAPLTLLIGDNSTGKTSFLAALRAVYDVVFQQRVPDFREPPYDLGSFPEIVHREGPRGTSADEFELGIRAARCERRALDCSVTFQSDEESSPHVSTGSATDGHCWIKWRNMDEWSVHFETGSSDESWETTLSRTRVMAPGDWLSLAGYAYQTIDMDRNQEPDDHFAWISELRSFLSGSRPFASAPIRSNPQRTYDPGRSYPDPQGDYVPTYLASTQFRDRAQWLTLKHQIEEFGRASGLFDDLSVKQYGSDEGAPFQLEVRKFGKRRRGRKRNLIDVGYGVSQALPLLIELFRPDNPTVYLLQQPEVHLHPSAQAALGSLFCATASSGRQLIIETHSDYILDRILLDLRDKRTELKPDDVSILYFEREDLDVNIHSIRIDDEGNVLDAPGGYRSFFKKELQRVIDY